MECALVVARGRLILRGFGCAGHRRSRTGPTGQPWGCATFIEVVDASRGEIPAEQAAHASVDKLRRERWPAWGWGSPRKTKTSRGRRSLSACGAGISERARRQPRVRRAALTAAKAWRSAVTSAAVQP